MFLPGACGREKCAYVYYNISTSPPGSSSTASAGECHQGNWD